MIEHIKASEVITVKWEKEGYGNEKTDIVLFRMVAPHDAFVMGQQITFDGRAFTIIKVHLINRLRMDGVHCDWEIIGEEARSE